MKPEDLFIQRRLSGITRQMTGMVQNLEEFRAEYPHVIAPNVMDAVIGNLKDDINILLREMNLIGSPNRKALEERRYVCRSCQGVFMTPLVAGVCDQCRARGITTSELAPAAQSESADEGEAEQAPGDEQSGEPEPLPEVSEDNQADPFAKA